MWDIHICAHSFYFILLFLTFVFVFLLLLLQFKARCCLFAERVFLSLPFLWHSPSYFVPSFDVCVWVCAFFIPAILLFIRWIERRIKTTTTQNTIFTFCIGSSMRWLCSAVCPHFLAFLLIWIQRWTARSLSLCEWFNTRKSAALSFSVREFKTDRFWMHLLHSMRCIPI